MKVQVRRFACSLFLGLAVAVVHSSAMAQTSVMVKRQFSPPDSPILKSVAQVGASDDWVVAFGQRELYEPAGNMEVAFYNLSESGAEYHSFLEPSLPVSFSDSEDVRVAVSRNRVAFPVDDAGQCKVLLLAFDGSEWSESQLMEFPQLDTCRQQLAFAGERLIIFDGRFVNGARRDDYRVYLATHDGSEWSIVDRILWPPGACGYGGSMDAQGDRFVFVCNQADPDPILIEEFSIGEGFFDSIQQFAINEYLGFGPIPARLSGGIIGLSNRISGGTRLFMHDLSGPGNPQAASIDVDLGAGPGGFGGIGDTGEFAMFKNVPDRFIRRFSLEAGQVVFRDDPISDSTPHPIAAEYSSSHAAIRGLSGIGAILDLNTGQVSSFPAQPAVQRFGNDIALLECAVAVGNGPFIHPDGTTGRVLIYPTCQEEETGPFVELAGSGAFFGTELESNLGNLLLVRDAGIRSLNLYEVSATGATRVGQIETGAFPTFKIFGNLILITGRDSSRDWVIELYRYDPVNQSIDLVDAEILDTGTFSSVRIGAIALDGNEGILSLQYDTGAWFYRYIQFSFSDTGLSIGATTDWYGELNHLIFTGDQPLLKRGAVYDAGRQDSSRELVRIDLESGRIDQRSVSRVFNLAPPQYVDGSIYFPARTSSDAPDGQSFFGMFVANPRDTLLSEVRFLGLGADEHLDQYPALSATASEDELYIGISDIDRGNTRLPGNVWEIDLDVIFADRFERLGPGSLDY